MDAIELQTGPADLGAAPNPFSATAIAFYENVLAGGLHVAAVGSSDSHQADSFDITSAPIGRGATVVYATSLSEGGIVAGVKADHTYVKPYGSDGPDIRLTGTSPGAPEAIFGDSLAGPVANFEATVTGAGPAAVRPGSYLMKLLRNGTEVASVPVVGDDFSHTFPASSSGRYSLEIVREDPTADRVEDYSSPIWFTRVAPSNKIAFGRLKLNRSKGSGTLRVKVPGPGRVSLVGGSLKSAKRRAKARGAVTLPLKAKGKALKTLRRKGRAKVKAKVKFAPDYGTAKTVTKRVTLVRT